MKSGLERDAAVGVEEPRPLFGVTPAVPWALQEQFTSLHADVPRWLPTENLRRFHLRVLVASLWQRLIATVREPVQRLTVDGQTVIEIVSSARIRRHDDGTLAVQLRELQDDGRLQWEDVLGSAVVLSGMPTGFLWLGLIRNAAFAEIVQAAHQQGIPRNDGDAGAYARELFMSFQRRLVRHADLRQMRRKIAASLHLDHDAVRIARRLVKLPPAQFVVRVADYNLVMRHKAALTALEREMPQLVPLYAAMVERSDFTSCPEPAQAVRQFLSAHGLGPRVWRLICRSGPRLLLPVRDFYDGDVGEAMLDYLRVVESLGLNREPHAGLMWDILSRYGHPAARSRSYLTPIRRVQSSFSHAAKMFMRLPPHAQAAERHELEAMLEWLATRDRGPLDKLQRRAGWPWLIENTHDWRALCEAEIAAEAATWTVPFDVVASGRYEMRMIASVADLWSEARAMHHCAHLLASTCASGQTIIASVREHHTHRRVATARIERTATSWQCTQIRGFANGDPEPGAMVAVNALVEKLCTAAAPASQPCPAFPITLGEPAAGRPLAMPRSARHIGRVEWEWSPISSRMEEYYLSTNRSRSMWLLWSRYWDDNWSRWEAPRVAAYGPRAGTTGADAASRLLAALWRSERDADSGVDRFHLICCTGLLTEDELMALGREVWCEETTK